MYQANSKPFNTAYSVWTARWWNWLHSFPRNKSPASDPTGQLSSLSQDDPNAWFLAGTLGGSANRACSIPYGKAILFPIITSAFSFVVDPELHSEEELTLSAKKDIDGAKNLILTIDDDQVEDVRRFRIRSEPFDDIIYGKTTRAVSDGYWAFLKTLSVGNHKIHFIGENIDFFNDVTYSLSILSKDLLI